ETVARHPDGAQKLPASTPAFPTPTSQFSCATTKHHRKPSANQQQKGMKVAFVFAAAAAVLASAPAQAVNVTVCQPGEADVADAQDDGGSADLATAPKFAMVKVTGPSASVNGNITTPGIATADGVDNCLVVAGFDFAAGSVIDIFWANSTVGVADHQATCDLAVTTRCTFSPNELSPIREEALLQP
ncbi:MAG: hypothetical protein BJ554DRAFT_686, partial [Olpidium bornovanus]